MPARSDLETILVIGSGPIIIGQACEFDYSGTQACRVLREEGYRVVLANSNPATIMTDPEFADATYIEPLSAEVLSRIIEREQPDALLPTLGGQTALNLGMELSERGILELFGVEMIGASPEAIACAEDRERFKKAMLEIGLSVPRSLVAHSLDEAMTAPETVGLPVIVRPAYILGGRGTGMASTPEELRAVAASGLAASPISEILIEQSIAGWKEFELEVMRDRADNCVVICSIENFDAMGVHTGDSITVAPAQTLSDAEYQKMRNSAFACIRRIGVETGGSNIQFALNPLDGSQVVIEMNPRVSRSSALASKATGFPIAKIAARLAVGCTLDEIDNDITLKTPASFEPTIDYVVTKVPRWAFEKFPGAREVLGTSMQSVGEVMAIGRTFPESLQKALRSLETGRAGLNCDPAETASGKLLGAELSRACATPTPERVFHLETALRQGMPPDELNALSGVDEWFLEQLGLISAARCDAENRRPEELDHRDWRRLKRLGFSDAQLGWLWGVPEEEVRRRRKEAGISPTFKTVDTCSAEFSAATPYHYSTYEDSDEIAPSKRPKVVILGSGPNRIGQGIEFDYCCVHASMAVNQYGCESVMVNCNPETVSTDYDTSDRLYFEPLTAEDVLEVLEAEARSSGGQGAAGVIVGLGGQTPLKLAAQLPPEAVLGTPPSSIDLAEDRERWAELCERLGIPQPPGGTASNLPDAQRVAERIGFPLLLRPSYVLGGRAMAVIADADSLDAAMAELEREGSLGKEGGLSSERPALLDRFLKGATEVDVDAVRDSAGEVLIGGIMEHVEEAGVHSGDSACVLPPVSLAGDSLELIEDYTRQIADALGVVGLLNVQFAVVSDPGGQQSRVYVIEANPRASRTVPFVSKATGVPLVRLATAAMLGKTLAEAMEAEAAETPDGGTPSQRAGGRDLSSANGRWRPPEHFSVKEAVLPFDRLPGVDVVLGPEMRCTGEVMGIDRSPQMAYAKSQIAAGTPLPREGCVLLSLADADKDGGVAAAKSLRGMGFRILATQGTAAHLAEAGVTTDEVVAKVGENRSIGRRALELIESGEVDLLITTPSGTGHPLGGFEIRRAAAERGVPQFTTIAAASSAADAIAELKRHPVEVRTLQEYHQEIYSR